MQNYKDLKVWEKGHRFTVKVYEITKAFPKEELYILTTQPGRAALPAGQILLRDAEEFLK